MFNFIKAEPTKINDKDLRHRIGQMLIIGFKSSNITSDSYVVRVINELNIGGVILSDLNAKDRSQRNILNPKQTKKLISDLQDFSLIPLFITCDVEGGTVNKLQKKYGFREDFLIAEELGTKDDIKLTKKVSLRIAKQLKKLGINLNFAPVVDLNINPDNPIIGARGRSFSADPNLVIKHSRAFIMAHKKYNVFTVLKHFPGHGSSTQDSHKGLVDITDTYKDEELIPYMELIKEKKVDMVMTAHVINKNIDPDYPATLSPLFIKDILRDRLGFDGLVVSDDMGMGAIIEHYGFEDALIRSINAGCDMLILANNGKIEFDEQIPYQAVDFIFNAVKNGLIPVERILEASERIMFYKEDLY